MNGTSLRKAVQADAGPEPAGEGQRDQSRARTSLRRPTSSWWLALLGCSAWLVLSGILLRLTGPEAAIVLLASVFALSASDALLSWARRGWPGRRKLAGHALAAGLAMLLGLVFAMSRGHPSPAAEVPCLLLPVIAVAVVGGLIPAVIQAVAGTLLLWFLVTAQPGAGVSSAELLGVLVGLAAAVSLLAEYAAQRMQMPQ
jgi:hypothetical protein